MQKESKIIKKYDFFQKNKKLGSVQNIGRS